jgi:hypothetical protein
MRKAVSAFGFVATWMWKQADELSKDPDGRMVLEKVIFITAATACFLIFAQF